ncbi:hypothetical protein CR513_38186, partial [Mucuna pruriens]
MIQFQLCVMDLYLALVRDQRPPSNHYRHQYRCYQVSLGGLGQSNMLSLNLISARKLMKLAKEYSQFDILTSQLWGNPSIELTKKSLIGFSHFMIMQLKCQIWKQR